MHVAEGILPLPVLIAGASAAALGTAVGLRGMDDDRTVRVAVMSSAFFVASLIHVPVGPVPEHLVLNGLMGLILGWGAFPAILIALALQALFFGYGGLTTLGTNTVIMALPAVVCFYLFRRHLQCMSDRRVFALGAVAGGLSVLLSCLLLCGALLTRGYGFAGVAAIVFAGHLPVVLVEAAVTGSAVAFLHKVRPETFSLNGTTRPLAETPLV
jgi:cobalt/nickel transport system permease protein